MPEGRYKDCSFASKLRAQISNAVSPFASPQQLFTPQELRVLLVKLFKFKQYEVSYQLLKMLFYGKSKYQHVKLDELVNYIAQKHLGENAINIYSLRQGYIGKENKVMNKSQFISTVNLGLQFLEGRNVDRDSEQFERIYEEIGQKGCGTISHEQYLTFLKEYFGSESPLNQNPHFIIDKVTQSIELIPLGKISDKEEVIPIRPGAGLLFESKYLSSVSKLTPRVIQHPDPLQEFKEQVQFEIRQRCFDFDSDQDGNLTKNEAYEFFYNVLELQRNSIDFILQNYFDFQEKSTVGSTELIEVISEVHFREIFGMLLKQELKNDIPSQCFMSCEFFVRKIIENCFFFKKKPEEELLIAVYKELEGKSESKKEGFITLEDFRSYILTSLCNNRLIFRKNSKKNTYNVFLSIPLSIAEVENSNFEQDSQCGEIRPRQFSSSICEPYSEDKLLKGKIETTDMNSSNPSHRADIRFDQPRSEYPAEIPRNIQNYLICIPTEVTQSDSASELIFSNTQRKKGSILKKSRPFLKDVLWTVLMRMVNKYSKAKLNFISKHQTLTMIESESFFTGSDFDIKYNLVRYFDKSTELSCKLLVSYLIHRRGEEALLRFNKTAIKGKSMLEEAEATELLCVAYGRLPGITNELCKEYRQQCKDEQSNDQISYKHFLIVVGRVLAQPPTGRQ